MQWDKLLSTKLNASYRELSQKTRFLWQKPVACYHFLDNFAHIAKEAFFLLCSSRAFFHSQNVLKIYFYETSNQLVSPCHMGPRPPPHHVQDQGLLSSHRAHPALLQGTYNLIITLNLVVIDLALLQGTYSIPYNYIGPCSYRPSSSTGYVQ